MSKKIKVADLLYYTAWILYFVSYIFLKVTEFSNFSYASTLYKYMQLVIGFILVLKVFIADKFKLKTLIIFVFVITLFLINSYFAKTEFLLFALLLIISSKDIDFNNLIKIDFKMRLFTLIIVLFLCFIGVIPNFTRLINGSFKHGFGFLHPNTLCMYTISLLLELMLLKNNNKLSYFLFNIVVLILLSYFCNSRTVIWTYLIVFLVYLVIKNKGKIFENKIISKVLIILPVILCCLSFLCVKLYDDRSPIAYKIDDFLTSRVKLAYRGYLKYGITFFGNEVNFVTTRISILTNQAQDSIDMGYIRIAYNNGVLILIIFLIFMMYLQYNLIKSKNYNLLLVSTFYIIIGFTENYIYILAYNFVPIALFGLLNYKKGDD